MSGRQKRTSRMLLFISVILSLLLGATLTQSAPDPGEFSEDSRSEIIIADSKTDGDVSSDDQIFAEEEELFQEEEPIPTQQPEADVTPTPTPEPDQNASPEASKGQWVADGENWRFEVDGTAYTGWFHDLDGKTYYFDKKGNMQTGWLNNNGKRYYFDEDGIMQTGKVPVDGRVYLFLEDGTMDGYAEPTPTPTPEVTPTPEPTPTPIPLPDGKKPSVALTFDDGPGDYTDRILDCLEENGGKATFFMVGSQITYYPDQVKRMEALGCELGNHTFNHKELTKLTAEKISEEIGQTDQALLELVGHGATVLRPPYGAINEDVKAVVGTPMVLWSIDTLDWETKNVDQTVQTVLDNVTDGSIILMHDIYEESAQAAEILIPKLMEAGYDLLTVHGLAERHEIELQTGIAYGEMNYN